MTHPIRQPQIIRASDDAHVHVITNRSGGLYIGIQRRNQRMQNATLDALQATRLIAAMNMELRAGQP